MRPASSLRFKVSADLGLEDITTTPYTFYQWNGSQYIVVASSTGNYNQGSAGAVTQTITAKLQQGISVKDFGAVGDGAHMAADTAGIKAAVAAGTALSKAVYVPAETTCWIIAQQRFSREHRTY